MALHISHSTLLIAVGILGNLISGMVYLAPLPTYIRIYKKKSTEEFQSLPYVVALFSSMLWLYYAFLKGHEYFLISINVAGCIIETLYIAFYYNYAPRKAKMCTANLMFSLNLVLFASIVILTHFIAGGAKRVHVLGYICAVVSTAVYAAPLTVMVKVIRTKSVEFMPFPLSFFLTLCAAIWFIYGLLRHDLYVSIPNVFGFILGLLQMVLYVLWKYCCFFTKEKTTTTATDTEMGNSGMDFQNDSGQQEGKKQDQTADHDEKIREIPSKIGTLGHAV